MIKFNDEMEKFVHLLFEYNKTHNITGSKNLAEIMANVEDSLKPLEFLDDFKTCVDIGTGAGFPGLILAMAKKDSKFFLVEPLKKRYAFLNLVKIVLGLKNVEIIPKRIEDFKQENVDLITSRAVTKTDIILHIASHLISEKTDILLYKGESVKDELENHLQKYDIIPRTKKGYYLYMKSKKC